MEFNNKFIEEIEDSNIYVDNSITDNITDNDTNNNQIEKYDKFKDYSFDVEVMTLNKETIKEIVKSTNELIEVMEEKPIHIQEYFVESEKSKDLIVSKELLTATRENVKFKTELNENEILFFAQLNFINNLLVEQGLEPVFSDVIYEYMNLKISYNRQSRGEFVNVTKVNNQDDTIQKFSELNSLGGNSNKGFLGRG